MNENDPDAPVGPERVAAIVRQLADSWTAWTREPGFEAECADRPPPSRAAA